MKKFHFLRFADCAVHAKVILFIFHSNFRPLMDRIVLSRSSVPKNVEKDVEEQLLIELEI